MPRLLIVDDDPNILASLEERFVARGMSVATATNGAEALAAARAVPDLILLDLQLPQGDGISVLRELRSRGIDSTVVVITAYGTVQRAVEAMREGAYDFLEKPFEPALIEEVVRRALERSRLRRENEALRDSQAPQELVFADASMRKLLETAKKAAASTSTVLVLGESGTGKELMARQIHAWSDVASGPFVAINCAALAETLLESELFGHEKGAFTGASARRKGKIELAHSGTLFLDEIGDVSPAFQAKLLRVLQERTFERVGGSETIEVDVRVIAATHRDLKQRVAEGSFREDLYYRLDVISLTMPPLLERPLDVGVLTEHFVAKVAEEAKRPRPAVSDEAMAILRGHAWPGNVRELRNAIERAVVLCEGDLIVPEDLPPDLVATSNVQPGGGFHEQVEAFRRRVLSDALEQCDGNRTRAAEQLGLQRTYFMRLIKKYGL